MAKIIQLRLGGGMFDMTVKAVPAVDAEDSETKLKNVCCGTPPPPDGAPRLADIKVAVPIGTNAKVPTTFDEAVALLLVLSADKDTTITSFFATERYPGGPHAPVPPKQAVICPECHTEHTSWHGWQKAHENDDSTYTVVDAAALTTANAVDDSVTKLIDLTLHDTAAVDKMTVRSGRLYNLEPGKDGSVKYNAYVGVVLRLQAKGKTLCCMYAVTSVPAMYRLNVIDGVLVLEELAKPETVRLRPAIPFPEAAENAVDMLEKVAEMSYAEFDPATYADRRKVAIEAAIAAGVAMAAGASTELISLITPKAAAADPFAALAAKLGVSEPAGTVEASPVKAARKKPAEKIPA